MSTLFSEDVSSWTEHVVIIQSLWMLFNYAYVHLLMHWARKFKHVFPVVVFCLFAEYKTGDGLANSLALLFLYLITPFWAIFCLFWTLRPLLVKIDKAIRDRKQYKYNLGSLLFRTANQYFNKDFRYRVFRKLIIRPAVTQVVHSLDDDSHVLNLHQIDHDIELGLPLSSSSLDSTVSSKQQSDKRSKKYVSLAQVAYFVLISSATPFLSLFMSFALKFWLPTYFPDLFHGNSTRV